MNNKKFLVFEIILLIALIASGIYGISVHMKSGTRRRGGEINIDNYEKYLTAECRITSYSNVEYNSPYIVYFRCTDSMMRITDLAVYYSIDAEYADFGSYSVRIELIDGLAAETVEGTVHFNIPASSYPAVFPDLHPKVTITAVSGRYSYMF